MKVDKITKDLIGREARAKDWSDDEWETILSINGETWWGVDKYGAHKTRYADVEWIIKDLPEPRKKPSERIDEIFVDISSKSPAGSSDLYVKIRAIIQYLDEREEKEGKE